MEAQDDKTTISNCGQMSDTELLEELRRRIDIHRESMRELMVLNQELKLVNKKLEESEALKSHFISNITNEIINPFTSILGLSRSILSVDKESWKKVISMVALIHSEAFSLDFQFRNIFFAAKIEAGEAFPEAMQSDILAVVQGVVENFKYELKKKRLKVRVESELPEVEGGFLFKTDPAYIRLVLTNLLSNAMNFSNEAGQITVRVSLEGGNLALEVKDNGAGMEEDILHDIFDRFTRGDRRINSVKRGHGLGLSICKAIADMLEGQITVESTRGQGSSFHFIVPESSRVSEGYATQDNELFFEESETF